MDYELTGNTAQVILNTVGTAAAYPASVVVSGTQTVHSGYKTDITKLFCLVSISLKGGRDERPSAAVSHTVDAQASKLRIIGGPFNGGLQDV